MSNNNIGYKKPPKQTQFKTGSSGNPNGRPKGKKNKTVSFILEKELNSILKLKDNSTMTKKEALVKKTVNNFLQSEDLSKSTKAIDLIFKLENKSNDDLLAIEFLEKMIKEKYVNIKDAENFVKNRKDPLFNIPKIIPKLDQITISKQAYAWEAVKNVGFLSLIYSYLYRIHFFEELISLLEEESDFWNNFEKVLIVLNLNKLEKKEACNLMQSTREYKRPEPELFKIAYTFLGTEKNNMIYQIFKERDKLMSYNYYSLNEEQYFDKSRVKDSFVKSEDKISFSLEEMMLQYECIKNKYDEFVTNKQKRDSIKYSDDFKKSDVNKLLQWLKIKFKPQRTKDEVIKQIIDKYKYVNI